MGRSLVAIGKFAQTEAAPRVAAREGAETFRTRKSSSARRFHRSAGVDTGRRRSEQARVPGTVRFLLPIPDDSPISRRSERRRDARPAVVESAATFAANRRFRKPDDRFADLGNPGWYRAGSDPPRLDESLDQPCREAPARRDSANRSCSGTSSYQYLAAVLPPPPNPRFQSEFAP